MPDQIVKAIYQDGAFHPTEPGEITLREGQQVELSVKEVEPEAERDSLLAGVL